MKFKYPFLLCCLLFTGSIAAVAQAKPAKPVSKSVQKFIPPKLYSSIGTKSDSVGVTVDEALQLVNLPLTITDDKKNAYTISSYQCMYKKRGVTEDEQTGRVSPVTSISVQRFTSSPLSELWRTIISQQLKTGEEIYFYDIVVTDAQKHLMFAPDVKLVIK